LCVPLRCALVHQADPSKLFIEGRETDLDWLDEQLPFELIELPLSRETIPDILNYNKAKKKKNHNF
jgi:hypothetical protein